MYEHSGAKEVLVQQSMCFENQTCDPMTNAWEPVKLVTLPDPRNVTCADRVDHYINFAKEAGDTGIHWTLPTPTTRYMRLTFLTWYGEYAAVEFVHFTSALIV